jgi:hypothetical protein
MREHADYYKQFIDAQPGGGTRRNPKRKNVGSFSAAATAPSAADIDHTFHNHLERMARGGTYGDNMEITAFTSAYNTDVKIYQRDFAYMISSSNDQGERDVAHIAYHVGVLDPIARPSHVLTSIGLGALLVHSQPRWPSLWPARSYCQSTVAG